MTREQKKVKRINRAKERSKKHMDKFLGKIDAVKNLPVHLPLSALDKYGHIGSWADPGSPTGYSQICSYRGICQSPCNGDC